MPDLGEQGRPVSRVVFIGKRIRLPARPHADTIDPGAAQVESDQPQRRPNELVDYLFQSGPDRGLAKHRTITQGMEILDIVGQREGADQFHIGTHHGDPAVIVEDHQRVSHKLQPLKVAELPGALPPTTHGAQELAFGRVETNLLCASIGQHECAVRPLCHAADAEEFVAWATTGQSEVEERLRIEAPQAGIGPEGPHRLDDLDAGTVALDDKRQVGVSGVTGGDAAQQEKGEPVRCRGPVGRYRHSSVSQLRVSRST